MASITESLVKSASERIQDAAKDAKQHVVNQFDPRRSIYQLGLGIGPLIRQTVNEYNKQQNKDNQKDSKKATKKITDSVDKSGKQVNTQLSKLSTHMDGMNRILTKMHKLNVAQLMELEAIRERSGGPRTGIIDKIIGTKTTAEGNEPVKDNGNLVGQAVSSLLDSSLGTVIKVVGGGLVAGELWKSLSPETKEQIKTGVKEIGGTLLDGMIQMWKEAFASAPWTTAAVTALAAHKLGVTGAAMGAINVGKSFYKVGKGVTDRMHTGTVPAEPVPVATPTATPAATAPVAEAVGQQMSRQERRALEMEKYQEFKNQGMRPGEARDAAKDFVKEQTKPKPAAPVPSSVPGVANEAGKVAEGAGKVGKLAKAGATAAKWGSRALPVVGAGLSGLEAVDQYQRGNNKLAALNAISATTGLAALGFGATGAGIPVAAILGGISLATGAAAAVGSYFVDDKPKPTETPAGDKKSTGGEDLSFVPQNVLKDEAFMAEIDRLAAKYGVKKADLLAVMKAENSSFDPSLRNPRGSATGLIQFTQATANGLGTSVQELAKMSRAQQMKYVEKYFDSVNLPHGATRGQIYTAVFKPAALKNKDFVLYKAGTKEYHANRELDKEGKGVITVADLDAASARSQGSNGGYAPPSSNPGELNGNMFASGAPTMDQILQLGMKNEMLKAFGDLYNLIPEILASGGDSKQAAAKPAAQENSPSKPAVPSVVVVSNAKSQLWYQNGGMPPGNPYGYNAG